MRYGTWLVAALVALSCVRPAWADDETERVRAVLREHPEILIDALRQQSRTVLEILEEAARTRQREAERGRFAASLAKPLHPDLSQHRIVRGPADAPVTIVEYSDFLCHYCGAAAATVKTLLKDHPKDVRLVYKHFATGKNDVRAALYFEAISLQDPNKAWAFMDAVFGDQKAVALKGDEALDDMAKKLGVDMKRLAQDLKRKELAARIKADVKEARDFGFEGTPVFLINGAPVRGAIPLDMLEDFVSVAAKAKPSSGKAASSPKKP